MRISVTQHHIDIGVRGSCSSDPIALAMREAGLEKPHAGPSYLTWRKDFKDYSVETPADVIQFMETFDNSPESAKPFEFEVKE
jgi:hypothetical protein